MEQIKSFSIHFSIHYHSLKNTRIDNMKIKLKNINVISSDFYWSLAEIKIVSRKT